MSFSLSKLPFYGILSSWHLSVMAEIIESGKKSCKRSTRVDLTPMVDLGFLLITFFIFTTAMSKPTGLKIFLPIPVPDNERVKTPESGALTILIAGENKIYYYEGADPHQLQLTDLSKIRSLIMDKKKRTDPEKFMVIIKPGKDSDFKTLIHIMDEMTINEVKRYAMVDIDPVENNLLQQR
jgi:biopolymer transport protein ExbD